MKQWWREYEELDILVNRCMWRWETCMRRAVQSSNPDDRCYWIVVAERFLGIMEGHLRKMRALTSMPALEDELSSLGISTEGNTAKDFGA